jgi:hypothetical protein
MLRIRRANGRCALALTVVGALVATFAGGTAAHALELQDEALTVAEDQGSSPVEEPAGESVGQPALEDATVEGEPGPGEAVSVPPDDLSDDSRDPGAAVKSEDTAEQPAN